MVNSIANVVDVNFYVWAFYGNIVSDISYNNFSKLACLIREESSDRTLKHQPNVKVLPPTLELGEEMEKIVS